MKKFIELSTSKEKNKRMMWANIYKLYDKL